MSEDTTNFIEQKENLIVIDKEIQYYTLSLSFMEEFYNQIHFNSNSYSILHISKLPILIESRLTLIDCLITEIRSLRKNSYGLDFIYVLLLELKAEDLKSLFASELKVTDFSKN